MPPDLERLAEALSGLEHSRLIQILEKAGLRTISYALHPRMSRSEIIGILRNELELLSLTRGSEAIRDALVQAATGPQVPPPNAPAPTTSPLPAVVRQPTVFLFYNSLDHDEVREFREQLINTGLSVIWDNSAINPGENVVHRIEQAVTSCRIAISCLGKSGFGPYHERETLAFSERFRASNRPFIPVFLASAPAHAAFPWTLSSLLHVDLRKMSLADAAKKIRDVAIEALPCPSSE